MLIIKSVETFFSWGGLDSDYLLPRVGSYFGLGAGSTWLVVAAQSHGAMHK